MADDLQRKIKNIQHCLVDHVQMGHSLEGKEVFSLLRANYDLNAQPNPEGNDLQELAEKIFNSIVAHNHFNTAHDACDEFEVADVKRDIAAALKPAESPAYVPTEACEQCGGKNVTWFTESPIWNKAVRGAGLPDCVCIPCFIVAAENAGFNKEAWKVVPEFYYEQQKTHESRPSSASTGKDATPGSGTQSQPSPSERAQGSRKTLTSVNPAAPAHSIADSIRIVQKHRRHVENSPGAGASEQDYALGVCDDILADFGARSHAPAESVNPAAPAEKD